MLESAKLAGNDSKIDLSPPSKEVSQFHRNEADGAAVL